MSDAAVMAARWIEARRGLARLEAENEQALKYATSFLVAFVNEHCAPVDGWKPLPDLMGVLTQIDNATTVVCDIKDALATKDATIATMAEDRRELLMAIENAARMAEQGILSADGGQCAGEIRALVPVRFRAALEESKP